MPLYFQNTWSEARHPMPQSPPLRVKRDPSTTHSAGSALPPEALVERIYRCRVCYKTCSSQTGLQNHVWHNHRGSTSKEWQCDSCERSYTTKSRLQRHVRQDHLGIYMHKCQVCDKGFSNPSYLRGHLVSHGAKPEFSCTLCGKEFLYKRGLQKHQQEIHGTTY